MRTALLLVVVLEILALAALGAGHATGLLDAHRREPPSQPIFKVPAYNAVIGDLVRYEILDAATGAPRGFLEYRVVEAIEYKGSARGRELRIQVTRTFADGTKRSRIQVTLPRALQHGFLPPRFEEDDDYPGGARPVVKTIDSAPVGVRWAFEEGGPRALRTAPGFAVACVRPRESLNEVVERFWLSEAIPIFGVGRWDRDGEMLLLLHHERGGA